MEELGDLKNRGVKEIHFGDASFGYPKENAEKILRGMIDASFGFQWSSYIHPLQPSAAMFDLIQKSGCHTLVFGIDSADESLLASFGRNVRCEELSRFVVECKKRGLSLCGDVMLGFPGETLESCRRTLEFAQGLGIDFISINFASPLMGSALRSQSVDEGTLMPDQHGFHTLAPGNGEIDRSSLLRLRRQALRSFYLRPSYLLRQLLRVGSVEAASIRMNEALGVFSKKGQEAWAGNLQTRRT